MWPDCSYQNRKMKYFIRQTTSSQHTLVHHLIIFNPVSLNFIEIIILYWNYSNTILFRFGLACFFVFSLMYSGKCSSPQCSPLTLAQLQCPTSGLSLQILIGSTCMLDMDTWGNSWMWSVSFLKLSCCQKTRTQDSDSGRPDSSLQKPLFNKPWNKGARANSGYAQGFCMEREENVNRDSKAKETLSENWRWDCLRFSMGVSKSFYMIFPGSYVVT